MARGGRALQVQSALLPTLSLPSNPTAGHCAERVQRLLR